MDSGDECFYDCSEGLAQASASSANVKYSAKNNEATCLASAESSTLCKKLSDLHVEGSNKMNELAEQNHTIGNKQLNDGHIGSSDSGRNIIECGDENNVSGNGNTKSDDFTESARNSNRYSERDESTESGDRNTDSDNGNTTLTETISIEDSLSEAEKEELRKDSVKLKEEGNCEFQQRNFTEAESLYSEGLRVCPSNFPKERSILLSNRSACRMHLGRKEEAIEDCTEALGLQPKYLKALMRRAQLYEELEKLDESLADYKSIVDLDPTMSAARAACTRLPPKINAKNEKMKEEMLGTLKDLGNKILGKFGLSTDNFQLQQNGETGGYNIQFNQNPGPS